LFGCLSVFRKSAGSLLAILAAGFAVSLCHYVQRCGGFGQACSHMRLRIAFGFISAPRYLAVI